MRPIEAAELYFRTGAAANATIIQGNVWTCNAVVQVIDEVLLPNAAVEAVDK